MLTVEEAVARCLASALPVRTESVALSQAMGRVLAEAVRAPGPMPPWDNSGMDGFAVRAADTAGARPEAPARLRVVETIAAGRVGSQPVGAGTCARIMTGAPLPAGADAIVIREDSRPGVGDPDQVELLVEARPGQHVRHRGEELRPGDLVLEQGMSLGPAQLGLCASLGLDRLQVARRPRVAIIATGDELVPPGGALGPGQIHASNSEALVAWVQAAGAEALDCGLAPDSLQGTRAVFQRALDGGAELLISTGGVSVGDFDVVKEAMAEVGAAMDFWKVAMKPGKPLAFGRIGGRPAFGLPGNPVSCQVGFLQFVRPVIRRSLGDPRPFLPVLDAVLEDGYRKAPGRAELVRVGLRWQPEVDGRVCLRARTTGDQGSARASGMAQAQGLALMAAEGSGAAPGQVVAVQVFDWSFGQGAMPGYRW